MPEDQPEPQYSFWGPLSTISWGIFIVALFIITGVVTVVLYVVFTIGKISPGQAPAVLLPLKYDGLLLSFCTFSSGVVCVLATVAVVKLKRGSNLREYLGLTLPNRWQFFQWFSALIAYIALSEAFSLLLGKPIVTEFMWKTYSSIQSPWILWVALLVAAPLSEEVLFRGFLIKGLSASALRWYGAVIVSSSAWAMIHIQYDIYGIVAIFGLGLVLGTARVKTGSIILTMFLHFAWNLVATAEVAIHAHRLFA